MNIEFTGGLLDLSLFYLQKKNKPITAYLLLSTCEKILKWSEQTNRFCKQPKIKFSNGKMMVDEKYFK